MAMNQVKHYDILSHSIHVILSVLLKGSSKIDMRLTYNSSELGQLALYSNYT